MPGILGVYAKKLHTRWPAGVVEKLPRIGEDGSTNVPGVYIVGDLTGIPLLKFSADSGARAVQTILEDQNFEKLRVDRTEEDALDLVVIGAGVSGMAAALEAKNVGLSYVVLEASEPFSTVLNFPKAKPIYAYPTQMQPTGGMQFNAKVKEPLIEELIEQTLEEGVQWRHARAEKVERKGKYLNVVIPDSESLVTRRVIIAIGRSGNFRKLGIPGEQLDKVYNRLHDPKDFCEKKILVVGGGDSALETTIALAQCGAHVVHVYRGKELSRPKPENIDRFYQLVRDPMADVAVEQPVSEPSRFPSAQRTLWSRMPTASSMSWQTMLSFL